MEIVVYHCPPYCLAGPPCIVAEAMPALSLAFYRIYELFQLGLTSELLRV